MICPKCGSDEIISDYFEEEWVHWCHHCGAQVDESEILIQDTKKEDALTMEGVKDDDSIPSDTGEFAESPLSSIRRVET